jgi:hypothetical protein
MEDQIEKQEQDQWGNRCYGAGEVSRHQTITSQQMLSGAWGLPQRNSMIEECRHHYGEMERQRIENRIQSQIKHR